MKHLRILAAALLIAALGIVCAFADIIPNPKVGAIPWIIYCLPVVVIIVAIVFLRRAIKRRRLVNDGMEPEGDKKAAEDWDSNR